MRLRRDNHKTAKIHFLEPKSSKVVRKIENVNVCRQSQVEDYKRMGANDCIPVFFSMFGKFQKSVLRPKTYYLNETNSEKIV